MEITEEQARAAQKQLMAAGRNAAVDDLTSAIVSGASPAEIARLEASAVNSRDHDGDTGEGAENAEGEEDGGQVDPDSARATGDLPPGEHKNAERIRLTGLEERDKGLVNAANIIARTEKIPFDAAWRRVNGDMSHEHGDVSGSDDLSQAEAGNETQETQAADKPGQDGGAPDEAAAGEALRQHHLQIACELYGDLKNPESELWREANRIATDPSHPDHDPELLAKPHGALVVAKLAAANLGLKRGDTGRGAAIQPRSHARPAAATKQSAPPPPARTQAEITRASEQAALDAIEGKLPPPTRRAERAYLRL